MNIIYQLQWTECNAFNIGETCRSLSHGMNSHQFTTTALNPDLPVAIHIQSHQIPFQECWSVGVIHKLPDSTPDHIHCQFEIAYQLVLHIRHITGLNQCWVSYFLKVIKLQLQLPALQLLLQLI